MKQIIKSPNHSSLMTMFLKYFFAQFFCMLLRQKVVQTVRAPSLSKNIIFCSYLYDLSLAKNLIHPWFILLVLMIWQIFCMNRALCYITLGLLAIIEYNKLTANFSKNADSFKPSLFVDVFAVLFVLITQYTSFVFSSQKA